MFLFRSVLSIFCTEKGMEYFKLKIKKNNYNFIQY